MKVFVPTSEGETVDIGTSYALPNIPSHGAVVRIVPLNGAYFRFGDSGVSTAAGDPRMRSTSAGVVEIIGIPEGATHIAVLSGEQPLNVTVGYLR